MGGYVYLLSITCFLIYHLLPTMTLGLLKLDYCYGFVCWLCVLFLWVCVPLGVGSLLPWHLFLNLYSLLPFLLF